MSSPYKNCSITTVCDGHDIIKQLLEIKKQKKCFVLLEVNHRDLKLMKQVVEDSDL